MSFSGFQVPTVDALLRAVSGRSAEPIRLKREYHRQRDIAERAVLADLSLFRTNACPACGEQLGASEQFCNPLGVRYSTCPDDGTVYADPVPRDEVLEQLQNHPAQAWPFLRGGAPGEAKVTARDDELAELLRMLPDGTGRRLLDVGCGTGDFLLSARRRFEAEGVELHRAAAEVARLQGLRVTDGRAEALEGNQRFDVITMISVIEHCAEPIKLFQAVKRLLAPGGHVYVVTPNIASASFRYLGRLHSHLSSLSNVSLFGEPGLRALARRAGFELIARADGGGRDLSLSDLATLALAPEAFRHRMSMYRPRMHQVFGLAERLVPQWLDRRLFPKGGATVQRALLVAVS